MSISSKSNNGAQFLAQDPVTSILYTYSIFHTIDLYNNLCIYIFNCSVCVCKCMCICICISIVTPTAIYTRLFLRWRGHRYADFYVRNVVLICAHDKMISCFAFAWISFYSCVLVFSVYQRILFWYVWHFGFECQNFIFIHTKYTQKFFMIYPIYTILYSQYYI